MITKVTAVLGVIGSISGGVYVVEDRYAHNQELAMLEQRFEEKIIVDDLYFNKQRIYQLQEWEVRNPEDQDLKRMLEEEKLKQEDLKEKLRILREKSDR